MVDKDVEAMKKVQPDIDYSNSFRFKKMIISVDGVTTQSVINDFVDNQFLARDTRAYREHIQKITPDVIFEAEYISQIGEPHKVQIPVGVRFFWPESSL